MKRIISYAVPALLLALNPTIHAQILLGPTATSVGRQPSSIFTTDLDRDGDNYLAVALGTANGISVLFNNGDGTFPDKLNYRTGNGPRSVFSVDLDRDGDNDLTGAIGLSKSVSVLLNNGDGTFAPKVDYKTGDSPGSVFSADLVGDGDKYLAVANKGIFDKNTLKLISTVSALLNLSIQP